MTCTKQWRMAGNLRNELPRMHCSRPGSASPSYCGKERWRLSWICWISASASSFRSSLCGRGFFDRVRVFNSLAARARSLYVAWRFRALQPSSLLNQNWLSYDTKFIFYLRSVACRTLLFWLLNIALSVRDLVTRRAVFGRWTITCTGVYFYNDMGNDCSDYICPQRCG